MDDNERIKARRLGAALTKKSILSLDEARSRLPELVMAELAGEDIERRYADVLAAIDQYPGLTEEYSLLVETMESDLGESVALPVPAAIPQFFAKGPPMTPGILVRRLGEQIRGLLVQLSPKPLSEPMRGVLSESAATYIPSIEYISEWLNDTGEPIQVTAVLQQIATAWELVVSLIPGSAAIWHVSATIGEVELPLVSREQFVTRFGPLATIPDQPIILLLMPEID
jgi:hypothetical protein